MEQVKRNILDRFTARGDFIRHALKSFPLYLRWQIMLLFRKQIELPCDLPYDREESVLALVQQQAEHLIPAQYPTECRQLDADPDTGCMEFTIRKGRLSFRLTAPYSEKRKRKASEAAKRNGFNRKP